MKIKYNAPTSLTFAIFCIIVLFVNDFFLQGLTENVFTVPAHNNFDASNVHSYFLLFSHILGHADWNHLWGNLAFILLLGPMLEESYGSLMLALMIFTTAVVTGVLNVCFFPQPLYGSSGVAFMMILLASFSNTKRSEVPLSFFVIILLYIGRDVVTAIKADSISQFAHLVGGVCGSLFGYFKPKKTSASI
ncbi:MAG: rhomboid family intramembrane serine protease [Treponema sp.]|nr:MAG: rhomboid family intramembrane serine protease [Treponema sp.]